jgi:hypothetical protein
LTWLPFLAQSYTMAHEDRKDVGRSDRYGFAGLIGLQFALLWPFRHYVTDDSYIHLQFARNLAAGQGFSFQPGEPIYGFTSPLWVLLLAAGERLGCDGLFLSRVLGLLFTVASVLAVYGLARVWIPERRYVWMATLAWAVDAWLLRWTFSGMDTSLGVFLVAMGFFLHARGRRDRTSPAPAMTFFSLAALSRPECLALCALAWLDASFGDGLPSVVHPVGLPGRSGAQAFAEAFVQPPMRSSHSALRPAVRTRLPRTRDLSTFSPRLRTT